MELLNIIQRNMYSSELVVVHYLYYRKQIFHKVNMLEGSLLVGYSLWLKIQKSLINIQQKYTVKQQLVPHQCRYHTWIRDLLMEKNACSLDRSLVSHRSF